MEFICVSQFSPGASCGETSPRSRRAASCGTSAPKKARPAGTAGRQREKLKDRADLGVGKRVDFLPSGKLTVCYWKWLFIVDSPIKNGDFPQLCKRLPEGKWISWKIGHILLDLREIWFHRTDDFFSDLRVDYLDKELLPEKISP